MKSKYHFLFIYLFLTNLPATTINIPADYATIQEGIDASQDGDIVLIAEGTYYENLTLNKEITLTSTADFNEIEGNEGWYNNTDIQNTIINGSVNNDPKKRSCLIIRDGDIQPTIKGLTFKEGIGTSMIVVDCDPYPIRSGGAILIYDAYPTINYNRFINNGMSSENERGRKAAKTGGAIAHYEDAEVEFDEDRNDVPAANSSNVERTVPGTMDIQNNYFENNSSGNGQDFYSQGYDGSIDVSSSVFANIDCETNTVNEYVLNSSEDLADYVQDDITGACIEDVAFYVAVDGDNSNNGTESSPFATIGHALSFVKEEGSATTVYVGEGVYSPDLTGEVFPIVMPNNVHLVGEDPETTILDAEADTLNEASVIIIKVVENVRVANLTLTGGSSEGYGCTGGGGIQLSYDGIPSDVTDDTSGWRALTYPVIENVIIEENHSFNGGGMSFYRVEGPVLNNVTIRNNTAANRGGGIFAIGSTMMMTGVTITGNECFELNGGGMMLAATDGVYDNMTITNNSCGTHGGGIWTNYSGGPESYDDGWTLINSTISGNTAARLGGGINFAWSHPTVINCTISDNTALWGGGGISGIGSGFTIKESIIRDNYTEGHGGGIRTASELYDGLEPPVIEDCIVMGNEAEGDGGGIILMDNIDAVISRTSVVNNHAAGYIGGIDVSVTTATITNVTVIGNTSGAGGGIGMSGGSSVDIANSIVWDNTGEEVWNYYSSVNVIYSDIQGGYEGEGNINADPLFIDVDAGDYGLQIESPCIDAGTADLDQDGVEDITDYLGGAPDMGAFEMVISVNPPTNITYVPQTSSVMLVWNAVSEFYTYMVEKSLVEDFSADIEEFLVEDNSFTDSDIQIGVEYFYRVTSILGNEHSDPSEVISLMIVPAPTGLAVTIQADESVYLTWDNDDNATSYQIQRSRDPMFFGPSDFFTSTENNYTDTDLTPGIRHYYTVSTYYGDYLSPSSQNVSALVVPAPAGVMVTVDESSVSLSWDAVDIAEVSYVIERATDSLFTADVEEFTSTENSFTDNSLEAEIEYYYRVSAVCCGGNSISFFSDIVSAMLTVMGTDLTASIPDAYSLQQNYPNPFNPTTKIRYGLKENTYVSINIYNLMGKHIRSYINTVQDAGYQTILWNATDASGQPVPAGMYIYSITAGDFRQTRKMILLK